MSRQNLLKDVKGNVINAFVPDPEKSQAPIASGGTITLSTYFDVEGTVAVLIRADADIVRYFNADTTKTRTIPANTDTIVLLDEAVTEVTLVGAATIEIEAM